MKTIKMSDEDYKDLMDLVKELNTQEHDSQASPRMWTIDTTHERVTSEGYGNTYDVVLDRNCENSIKIEELNKELLDCYKQYGSFEKLDEEYDGYINSPEEFEEWCKKVDFEVLEILQGRIFNLTDYLTSIDREIVACEEYEKHELNATLFKSDAKRHIIVNGHNLNKNPHTYAFSVYRMPKMQRLYAILEKLGGKENENN